MSPHDDYSLCHAPLPRPHSPAGEIYLASRSIGLTRKFSTVYDIITPLGTNYLAFMCWIGLWAVLLHWILAVTNSCNWLKYVTRFPCDTFGFYVAFIYLQKGIQVLERFGYGARSTSRCRWPCSSSPSHTFAASWATRRYSGTPYASSSRTTARLSQSSSLRGSCISGA